MKSLKLLLLLTLIGCESYLFQPEEKIYQTPDQKGLNYKESYLKINDNTIHYWHLIPKKRIGKSILHFHGNSHNISYHFKLVSWLVTEGYDVFLFDYPGFGNSRGELSLKNYFYSSIKVIEEIYKVHKELGNNKFFILGQSLGGNLALASTAHSKIQKRIDGIILDSTFMSYQYIIYYLLRDRWYTAVLAPLSYLLINDTYSAFVNHKYLEIDNILITHSMNDSVIPHRFASRTNRLINAKNKKVKIFTRTKHIETFSNKRNQEYLLNYLRAL